MDRSSREPCPGSGRRSTIHGSFPVTSQTSQNLCRESEKTLGRTVLATKDTLVAEVSEPN